jgi:hypothetical protein
VKLFKENNARTRCLTDEEEARLFTHLPNSIKPLVTVALHTGMDLYTVQRLGGWKTAVMVQRYAHLSPDHMRAAVERLARNESGTQSGTGRFRGNPGDGVSAEEHMVTRLGVEPRTPGLKGRYSAC